MEGDWVGLVLICLHNVELSVVIVPDSHCFVLGAGCDELFFDADIKAFDGAGVEGIDEKVVSGLVAWSLEVDFCASH